MPVTLAEPGHYDRLRAARAHAAAELGCVAEPEPRKWGRAHPTAGGPVVTAAGRAWLRVLEAPVGKPAGRWWTGTAEAENLLPSTVPRPRLLTVREWTTREYLYRAELTSYVPARACSDSPDLRRVPSLPGSWHTALRAAVDAVSLTQVPPGCPAVISQNHLSKGIRHFLSADGVDTEVSCWTMAHGDMHWANLTAPELTILDWEVFGAAPRGYDAASLYAYALPEPDTAAAVRRLFADVLDTPEGRIAELAVAVGIVMSGSAGHVAGAPAHHRLAPLVRAHARRLLS